MLYRFFPSTFVSWHLRRERCWLFLRCFCPVAGRMAFWETWVGRWRSDQQHQVSQCFLHRCLLFLYICRMRDMDTALCVFFKAQLTLPTAPLSFSSYTQYGFLHLFFLKQLFKYIIVYQITSILKASEWSINQRDGWINCIWGLKHADWQSKFRSLSATNFWWEFGVKLI